MKLIDNRYRVDEILEDSLYSSLYRVTDFWDDDKKLFMKLYNTERQADVISYFIENFIALSNVKHRYLLTANQFDIIKTIDRKKVDIKQYYLTTEYISAPSLDEVYMDLSLEDRLYIILQLCTVLDFIHYRGLVYKYLSPSHIYVLEDNSIKLMDLATINERTINRYYDDLTRYFIAPEVLLEHDDIIDKEADKYSLGMIIAYLLTEDFYNFDNNDISYMEHFPLGYEQKKLLSSVIVDFTKKDPVIRKRSLRELIYDINTLFSMNYKYDLVEERGTLNFKTKIVGREKEINAILSIDDNIFDNKLNGKMILVKGDTGLGKTRFLKEISYLLKMRGRNVYFTEVLHTGNTPLKAIENLLRQTIKDTPTHIMSKFGKELARVLPELKYMLDIDYHYNLGEDRERLRLYDRIASYLEELSKDKPIYLIIDNVDNGDPQLLFLLDYIFKSLDKGRVVLILAINENKISKDYVKEDIIRQWSNHGEVEQINMTNLDLSEIGELIQYILGISYKPLKFSAVMLKESQGNPRYIEYMMKDLHATGELYLSAEGYWEIKTKKYSDIYFPSSIDEALKSQIYYMKKEHRDIIEIISIYDSSVSKNTLLDILNMDKEKLDKNLEELVDMGIIEERVADWGYSYSISNIQLKRIIYHQIPQEQKMMFHKRIAKILESKYSQNYKSILDELTYHLMSSNQREKALEYLVKEAEEANAYSSKGTLLWEEAYEIASTLDSEHKIKILENLGRIYSIKGENQKALNIYKELFKCGQELDKIEYLVMAKIGMGEIFLNRSSIELALKEAQESIEISKAENYIGGFIKASILYNKILLDNGNFEEVKENMKELLVICLSNGLDIYLGDIYNIIGLSHYYTGDMDNAINNYEKSIHSFQQVNNFIDSTKPINNLANIFIQHGKIAKANEYYEKGLDIVDRYGVLNLKMIFLNNIGSTYIITHDYEKGKKYIEESRTIAIEMEEANIEFLTNINLGLIHLYIGEYEQSYNYYIMLKEKYSNSRGYSYEVISYYYNFLSEFYYTFGRWEEALKYSNMAIEACKDFSNVEFMMSKVRKLSIRYLTDGVYDKDSIEELREELKIMKLSYNRRDGLLRMAIIPYLEGDYEYVLDILKEDIKLKEKYSAPILDYKSKILLYGIGYYKLSKENLLDIEKNMRKYDLPHIDVYANIILGSRSIQYGKPYQAINYLLEALDLIYGLIKNIPDRELQIGYIKRHKGDDIKLKMTQTIEKALGIKVDSIYIKDIDLDQNIEKYFDYRPLIAIMDDEDFNNIIESNYYYGDIKDISNIETLISNLTSDYEYNLNLILKYIGRETLAEKGYILAYDDEKSKYLPIASLNNNDMYWFPNENLLSLANRYEDGILITNGKEPNIIGLHREFLSKDIRALICVPIKGIQREDNFLEIERRRKNWITSQKVEGYIYLETGRVFNRFDNKRLRLTNCLSQILYMSIENYKLKILSTIDKLTGIYTRKYFENQFNRVFDEARLNSENFAILMLDIDRFKNINDTYGHRKGDEVLNRIGQCIKDSVRKTDIVARYGGEEFIIILRNVDLKEAKDIGEKIRINIQELRVSHIEEPITISIGISQFPKHSQFKEELIEKADQALYNAKEKGRNKVVVWEPHLENTLNRVDKLAGILSGNINQDQINILALLDIIELINSNINKEEKILEFLGRLVETIEGEYASLILFDKKGEQGDVLSRSRLNQKGERKPFINQDIVNRAIANRKGEFLIDWDSLDEMDLLITGTPNWQSVIVIPLEFEGEIKGIVYISVPLKEKEFDYNDYNMVRVLCSVISAII